MAAHLTSIREDESLRSALDDGGRSGRMVRQRIHTGYSCPQCRRGKNREVRQAFARKLRRRQKVQLLTLGGIGDVDMSIGYTD
ncbi:hypothetical protein HX89_04085 [Dermacoccus nishinomiyaensis]|uniref:Uncharacterized protein n=1 Tax=Dermacoccus nishinomiyaensis TaxID=1274 RepID=A0A075JJR0_9MICO|nr:hypothetical protein HX89_04085 [Dermacoccus nishinomiyaensis]